jgi:hypothetical protein
MQLSLNGQSKCNLVSMDKVNVMFLCIEIL